MIRLCPNCETERPLTEFFCEGLIDNRPCHWDLTNVDIHEPGWRPPNQAPPPSVPAQCPNGHPISYGDLICPICEAVVGTSAPPGEEPTPTAETIIEGWRLDRRLEGSSAVRERYIAVRAT